ncbi:hypothetical protein ACFVXQ_01060 [Kitasatospora sp. NPDC058263]
MSLLGGTGKRVRVAASAGLDALAVRMAVRPRRAFAVLTVLVVAVMSAAPATPAVADDNDCGPSWISWTCSVGGAIIDEAKNLPGIGGVIKDAESATKAIDALTPANLLDTWAQGLCHAVIFVLTFIQSTAEKLAAPAYTQQWWLDQYAVTFGLSLIFLAFMLLMITARIGGGQGSTVSGIELMRRSGVRLVFVVPGCALAPALMYSLQGLASELSKTFSTQAAVQANGAVGSFLSMIQKHAGNGWTDFGGTLMVIVLMIPILILGIVLLIEIAVSSWGLMICGLLVPLVAVAAVYPPWAQSLRRLAGIIAGMMFMPAVVFFFFWTVWSAVNSLFKDDASNSPVTICLFLLVSVFMIDIFPIVCIWLLSIVAPAAEQMPGDVRAGAPNPSPGDIYDGSVDKMFKGGGKGGGGSDGEDGDSEDGEDGSDGQNGSDDSSDSTSKGTPGGDDSGSDDGDGGPDGGGPGGGGAGGPDGGGDGGGGDDGGGGGSPGGGGGGGGGDLSPRLPGGSITGSKTSDGGGGGDDGGGGGSPGGGGGAPAPAAAAA